MWILVHWLRVFFYEITDIVNITEFLRKIRHSIYVLMDLKYVMYFDAINCQLTIKLICKKKT